MHQRTQQQRSQLSAASTTANGRIAAAAISELVSVKSRTTARSLTGSADSGEFFLAERYSAAVVRNRQTSVHEPLPARMWRNRGTVEFQLDFTASIFIAPLQPQRGRQFRHQQKLNLRPLGIGNQRATI